MFELIYWVVLIAATYAAFVYFRDLGDIPQALLDVSRENMLSAIRNENKLVVVGLMGTALAVLLHYAYGAGIGWVTITLGGTIEDPEDDFQALLQKSARESAPRSRAKELEDQFDKLTR